MQTPAPTSHVQLPAALITCHCGLASPAKALKSKSTFGGVRYRSLDVKTELLSPEASLYQQLEFHRAAEERETQETGDGLEHPVHGYVAAGAGGGGVRAGSLQETGASSSSSSSSSSLSCFIKCCSDA
ncbi:unnamed protein product [Pleuronectes platessa]|uniref:Uncharacterized protein n=1 Tax=Pleuronectes platessa TaxID=8262 RepID=A0A9N7UPQ7_PLEPL|nr:unnamed protein product [Pleuronectes platessa]